MKLLSQVQLFATPWTVAHQASQSMGFSRQEYWSGLPVPSPGDLPDPEIEPMSPTLQADALTSEPPGKPIFQLPNIYLKNRTLLAEYSKMIILSYLFDGKEENHITWEMPLYHWPELSNFSHSLFSFWLSLSSDFINSIIKVKVI